MQYLVTTRRGQTGAKTALAVLEGDASVSVVQVHTPDMVTVEAEPAAAEALKARLEGTHFVEPLITRGLH